MQVPSRRNGSMSVRWHSFECPVAGNAILHCRRQRFLCRHRPRRVRGPSIGGSLSVGGLDLFALISSAGEYCTLAFHPAPTKIPLNYHREVLDLSALKKTIAAKGNGQLSSTNHSNESPPFVPSNAENNISKFPKASPWAYRTSEEAEVDQYCGMWVSKGTYMNTGRREGHRYTL